ncbi:hypothetical protein Ancab_008747, partial [Ancistrocladus abbreviatus]
MEKYGSKWLVGDLKAGAKPSRWAIEIGKLNLSCRDNVDWLCDGMKKKIGNENDTSFWYDVWVGDLPLCLVYPRPFLLLFGRIFVSAKREGGRTTWSFLMCECQVKSPDWMPPGSLKER